MTDRDKILFGAAGVTGLGLAAWKTMFPWIGYDIRSIRCSRKSIKTTLSNFANKRFVINQFEDNVRKSPKKTFIIFEDKEYSYEMVDAMANKIANFVSSLGIKATETVAMMYVNEPAFVWTFLGLQKIGVAAAFINYHLRLEPLAHSLNTCRAKAIIIGEGDDHLESIEEIRKDIPENIPIFVQGKQERELPVGYRSLDEALLYTLPVPVCRKVREKIHFKSPVCYIYTSGTTGLPKPAIINQAKSMGQSAMFLQIDFTENDIIYVVTPLYHSAATCLGLFNTIGRGATIVLRRKFSARHYWEDVRKYNVTFIQYIGELCRYLLRVPENPLDGVHKVRAAIGNGLRRDIWKEFQTRFKIPQIYEFFGATEGTSILLNYCNQVGALGRWSPVSRYFIRGRQGVGLSIVKFDRLTSQPVRDKNGRCITVKPGEEGILLSGVPPTHSGFYLGTQEMNEKKLVRNAFQDGDLFFNFGDTVYLDNDYFVYFRDRIGDTFRWKGENVSTTEVAHVLSEIDFINDVNVYGVTIPGSDGRAGMAAIQLKGEREVTSDKLHRIYSQCNRHLPSYARPLFIRFMDEFIITQTMKHKKLELIDEGFDIQKISDPLYYIDTKNETYRKIDQSVYQTILTSRL